MPAKTLRELEQILRDISRVRARLERINARKLPVYWGLQPRVFEALGALECALKTDQQALLACVRETHR